MSCCNACPDDFRSTRPVAAPVLQRQLEAGLQGVRIGDGPEGLAVSPVGGYAASLLLNGTGAPKTAFFHHDHSLVALLKIDGKKVRKVGEALVTGGAEGIAFSPDGRFLYVGSYNDGALTILRLQGEKLMPVGALRLPGHPASLRGNTP